MQLYLTRALLWVARWITVLCWRWGRVYEISICLASCGGGVGCVGLSLTCFSITVFLVFCSFSNRSVVLVHFCWGRLWTGSECRPQAYSLHGETAGRYQGATGNLSAEASQGSSGLFLFLIVNNGRLVKRSFPIKSMMVRQMAKSSPK